MTVSPLQPPDQARASWLPMLAIALGQMILSYNVAALPVVMGGMVASFGVPATTVATGIVTYGMIVAGFVMLGAKLVQRFGALQVFRLAVLAFGAAQILLTFSPTAGAMIGAQALCGMAAAAIVPSLVALVAENYHGAQQATALGALGSTRAAAGVLAFLLGGILGTWVGWRPVFAVLIVIAALALLLSLRLKRDHGRPEVSIDWLGVLLAASAIILVSTGFNNLGRWGLGLAGNGAPFTVLGLSPAPVMIVVGTLLGQSFLAWTRRRSARGATPLLALQVIESPFERAAVFCMFAVMALEAALNFSVPLYIQIVQGQTPFATAIAMLPFNLTVVFTAMLVVRLYARLTPRRIGRYGFMLCAAALLWLAFVVRNDWSEIPVMFGLVLFGVGQGALVTLLFNVLVTSSPKALAGDVGSLRGTTNNLGSAVGTALAGAMLVGLLSTAVTRQITDNPILTRDLQAQLNLDSVTFVSNARLAEAIARTDASAEQKAEALRINTEARLLALKLGLLVMAGLAMLSIFPAGRLPNYRPGEIPE